MTLLPILLACRGPEGGHAPDPADPTLPADVFSDTTVASLELPVGETLTTHDGAWLTVTGDATIDGTLHAVDGPLRLRVLGRLTVAGELVADAAGEADPTAPFDAATTGIAVVVEGDADFLDTATVRSSGNVVVADGTAVLGDTPEAWWTAAATLEGELPGLSATEDDGPAPPPLPRAALPPTGDVALRVSGTWDLGGVPGDRPVLVFSSDATDGDLLLERFELLPPSYDVPPEADGATTGVPATGRAGRNGLALSVWNAVGAVAVADTTLTLASGEEGAAAIALCAAATGGDGGKPGRFSLRGARGVQLRNATIEPGRGGSGGNAETFGLQGVAGAPGTDGCDTGPATGGRGADVTFILRATGNVTGLDTLTVGDLFAGDGGSGTATAEDGGDGDLGWDGGAGGSAIGIGGAGGDARLEAPGLPVTLGIDLAGVGGNATATAGSGGTNGDCDPALGTWGTGGDAGAAAATPGEGGRDSLGTSLPGLEVETFGASRPDGAACAAAGVLVDALGDAFDPASFVPGVGFAPTSAPSPDLVRAEALYDAVLEQVVLSAEVLQTECYEVIVTVVALDGSGRPVGPLPDPRDGAKTYFHGTDVCVGMGTIQKWSQDAADRSAFYPDGTVPMTYDNGMLTLVIDLSDLPLGADQLALVVYFRKLGGGADTIPDPDGSGYTAIVVADLEAAR